MSLKEFLDLYPSEVTDLLLSGRAFLFENVPGLQEELDLPSRILVYRVAAGMRGIVFTLIPSKKGVKLGIYRGRELDDPACLMEGSGKVHTVIPLSEAQIHNPDFRTIVDQAVAKAHTRLNPER